MQLSQLLLPKHRYILTTNSHSEICSVPVEGPLSSLLETRPTCLLAELHNQPGVSLHCPSEDCGGQQAGHEGV